VRMEDLDQVVSDPVHEAGQLADLEALGLDWDGEVVRQSERRDRYDAAITRLDEMGLVYDCFCSRKEILSASAAPHGPSPEGAYPGTCRELTAVQRSARVADGRRPAKRLRTDGRVVEVFDALHGPFAAVVDDLVLRRNDGTPAYNLAVVVDDAAQGVDQVVRGDDLLPSTPRQVHLGRLLGLPTPSYVHVPLVLNRSGVRLAKRDGAVTLADRLELGEDAVAVRSMLAGSLGLCEAGERPSTADLLQGFRIEQLPTTPWTFEG